jgi:alpha-L-rhamnosidase
MASLSENNSIKITELLCEYLNNPLGIDVQRPRLSWKLFLATNAHGQRQTAYQVLVSSSKDLLAKNKGDLWDSGEIASDQSVHVVYDGKALASGMRCYWKVRIRDENGRLSEWSSNASWTMGLLNASDWKAKWIGSDIVHNGSQDNNVPDPWMRKSFLLKEEPKIAIIYIASVGYHELYVNGKKVGDAVLSPSVAYHKKRARYMTYEIQDYLEVGQNVIGLWLGASWSIYPPYKTDDKPQTPIVIAQADIQFHNGQTMSIVTDDSWKVHPSPNMLLGNWVFGNYGGEIFNDDKNIPNWCGSDLDDSDWKTASIYNPNLTISAEMIEPNRRITKIKPIYIEEKNGDYRVDMGVNFAGMVEIGVTGVPNKKIEFEFSERPDQSMVYRLRSAYIIGSSGKGTFRNHFNYSVGRWITIKGLESKPDLSDIRGYQVRTDYRISASFKCSDELLNDIYNKTIWTFENLSLGGYVVDCPHRERLGYGGDAHATMEMALSNLSVGAFYTKWLMDWRDVQKDDGDLPYTSPTYMGGGGPAWSGICITLPWQVYRFYDDKRILEECYPTMQKWITFLNGKAVNDILQKWGGEWDFLGDWVPPGKGQGAGERVDERSTLLFNNCYYLYNMTIIAEIADLLGKPQEAKDYKDKAEMIRKAVHQEFFNPENNTYANGEQLYEALPLLVKLTPDNIKANVMKTLENKILVEKNGHIDTGIHGTYFLIKTLIENDRNDLIFEMATKRDYPSWGYMLDQGATTIWEQWDGVHSLLHSSFLSLCAWFIQGLGGIMPENDGFKSFIIKPGMLAKLKWVKAEYDSVYGKIASKWKLENGKLKIKVAVPPNTTAKLFIPTTNPQSIKYEDKPLSESNHVKRLGVEGRYVILQLDSGKYRFEADF